MIEIKTQLQFDAMVASTPTNQMILIYPRTDGEYYSLSQIWNIDSNTYIKGVGNPIIQYMGDTTFERYRQGAIMIKGKYETRKVNIHIKGITLLGRAGIETYLIGIMGDYLAANANRGDVSGDQGNHNASGVGVTDYTSSGMCIENCTIKNFYSGIYLENANCCKILSNTIEDMLEDGINHSASYASIISDNFINNAAYPIYVSGSGEMTIYNNTCKNSSDDMFSLDNCDLIVVKDNKLLNATNGALKVFANSYCNSLIGNQITHSTAGAGVTVERGASSNTIACNIATNTWVGFSAYTNAIHNSFHSNVAQNNSWGLAIEQNSNGNVAVGNIITNNQNGIYHESADYNVYYGNISNNTANNFQMISGTGNEVNMDYNIVGGQ